MKWGITLQFSADELAPWGDWEDLSDLGLRVRYRDGSENVFLGVLRYPGEAVHDAVDRFCREANATVYVPNDEEGAARQLRKKLAHAYPNRYAYPGTTYS